MTDILIFIGILFIIAMLAVIVVITLELRIIDDLEMQVKAQKETIEIMQDKIHEHTEEITKILFSGGK